MPAPVASGWSGSRAGLAPAGKAPPCHGARGKPSFVRPSSIGRGVPRSGHRRSADYFFKVLQLIKINASNWLSVSDLGEATNIEGDDFHEARGLDDCGHCHPDGWNIKLGLRTVGDVPADVENVR